MPQIIYRPVANDWQGERRQHPKDTPFRASWTDTKDLLYRELDMLRVPFDKPVVIQIDLPESGFRNDGHPRVDARDPAFTGVILSVVSIERGPLRFQCDRFTSYGSRGPSWQANVRAIALGLEALRKVERYGIAGRGEQYTGWKALGAATAMPEHTMGPQEAAEFIAANADWPLVDTLNDVRSAYRLAAKRLHPDVGGDPEMFKLLNTALSVLTT